MYVLPTKLYFYITVSCFTQKNFKAGSQATSVWRRWTLGCVILEQVGKEPRELATPSCIPVLARDSFCQSLS
jgi:hypothetical protein